MLKQIRPQTTLVQPVTPDPIMDELCSIDPTIFQSQWSAEEYIPQSMILRKHQDKSCRQDSRSSAANEVNTNSRRSEDLSFVSVPNTPKSTSDIKSQLNIQTGSEGDVVTSDSNPSSNIHDPPHLKPFNIIQYLKEPYSQGTQGTSFIIKKEIQSMHQMTQFPNQRSSLIHYFF